jgi:hypothetical protein
LNLFRQKKHIGVETITNQNGEAYAKVLNFSIGFSILIKNLPGYSDCELSEEVSLIDEKFNYKYSKVKN